MSLNTTFVYQINVGELAFRLDELPEGEAGKKSDFSTSPIHVPLNYMSLRSPAQTTFARLKTINHVEIYLPTFIKRLISPREN